MSSGGLSPAQDIALGPGYQVPFAAALKRRGRAADHRGRPDHRSPTRPRRSSPSGAADAVALARAMLYDPRWPWHAAAALGARVAAPPQYLRSQPRELKDLFVALRPAA